MSSEDKITILVIEPLCAPQKVEMPHTLKAMQECVHGDIEIVMPFDDDVAIICNECGKLDKLEQNRTIYQRNGNPFDIIHGTFFLCYAPLESENFLSLNESQIKKYAEIFKEPEVFSKETQPFAPNKKHTNRSNHAR